MTNFVDLYRQEPRSSVEFSEVSTEGLNLNLLWKTRVLSLVLKTKSRNMLSLPFMAHRMLSLFKICHKICLIILEIYSHWIWKNCWALKWILSFVKRMSFVKTHELDLLMKETRQWCFDKFSSHGEFRLFSRGPDCRLGVNFGLRCGGPARTRLTIPCEDCNCLSVECIKGP